jgi:hypothetical protein
MAHGKHRLIQPPAHSRIARRISLLAVGLVAMFTLTGCFGAAKITEPFNDAQRAKEFSGPADVITMPDGFSNLATKCGPGGNRYTVAFHSDSPYAAVSVVADPTCPK